MPRIRSNIRAATARNDGRSLTNFGFSTSSGGSTQLANYLQVNGVQGNYATTPDSAATSITGDIELQWFGSLVDWTPAASQVLLSKWDSAGSAFTYQLYITTDGKFNFDTRIAAATVTLASTSALSVVDGQIIGLRATRVSATGQTDLFTSLNNGLTWNSVGSAVLTSGAMTDNASRVIVGANDETSPGNFPMNGRIFRARILSTIGSATAVADFNPNVAPANVRAFTASTGEVWTLVGSATLYQ